MLIIVEIFVTNELVVLGKKLHEIDTQVETLTNENEDLRASVASASSLVSVGEKALQLGFVKPTQYLTIHPDQFPVALGFTR